MEFKGIFNCAVFFTYTGLKRRHTRFLACFHISPALVIFYIIMERTFKILCYNLA
ncbi:hypothetical protein SRCM100169_03008 [Bacillus siamensis]|nr:hypothetical protein SRCM100169_03008 [Bacillus siamensis]